MPFLPIEFGTPLRCSFMRGRNGFGSNILSEPLMTEFCAIYLGDKAYTLETSAYRERVERTYQGPQQWSNWQNAPELDQAPAFQAVQDLFIRNTWRSWRTWGLTAGMVPWSMGHGWTVDPAKQWDEEPVPSQSRQRGAARAGVRKAALHYLQPDGNWATYPAGQALVDSNSGTLAWIAGPPERFTAKDHLFESGEQISKQVVLPNDERTTQSYRAEWKIELDGRQTSVGERTGQIRPAENLFVPVSFTAPEVPTKSEGRIILEAAIGMRQHRDEFAFRVFPRGAPTRLLRDLGYALSLWDGQPHAGQLVVIGRHALDGETPLPGLPEKHVAAGGRLLILGQSPDWFRDAMGLRVAHHVSRRFLPVPSQSVNPILAGLDAEDFRDWRGAGTLVPETWGGLDERPDAEPRHGWHWGNQGSVSSCAVEKPHYSGWRPILEGGFDLAYSPLMELSYGPGMAVLCTLDLEGRTQADPVARLVASRVVAYALQAGAEPRAASTVYIGGDAGRKLLRSMGLRFEAATQLPTGKVLAVLGADASVTRESLESLLRQGGRALLLPRPPGTDPWGAVAQLAPSRGATDVPAWSECRGLSLSDLRLRGTVQMAPVAATGPVLAGAGGLLGRVTVGPGVAVMLQLSPDMLPGREKTHLRHSQWRLTRTLTQLLANLGGTFEMDARSLSPGWNQQYLPLALAGAWQFRAETVLPPATDPNVRTNDPGRAEGTANWEAPDSDTRAWRTLKLPSYWESLPEVGERDGVLWVRREVQLPQEWADQELLLQLGNVDDADVTWFNGVRVGETSGWNVPRSYRIPAKLVRAGRNVIAIRVFDEFGGGGFGAPAGDMRLGRVAPQPVAEGEEILHNGDLADGLRGWHLGVFEPAQATAEATEEAPPELLGQRAVRVAVTKPSETSWHVQLSQPGFGIQAGVHYVWSAWAGASAPCSIIASIEKNHPPYGGAGLSERFSLTPEWRRIRIDFTPRESDENVRFGSQELARQAVTYWSAAPSFMVAPDRSPPREVAQLRTFYSPDYIEAFDLGDDPYRYYRW